MPHSASDPKLESLARTALKSLFDRGAQVVSNECLPGVGNSQIFIRVLDIEVRIIQTEGSLSVLAAPCHATNSWRPVESLLMAIDEERRLPPAPVYDSLEDLGSLLESRLQSLNDALSREHFPGTVQAARQSRMKELIALKPRVPVRPSPARQVVAATVRGIARTVQFLFPKPKDPRAKFLPVGSDHELEQQVRQEFGSVFRNFGARIYSNGRLRTMDFAAVTFDVGNLRIRATRDRGSIFVSIAPIYAIREWQDLGVALQVLRENELIAQSTPSSILRGAGRLLETDFVKLNDAFSEDKYATTRKRIRETSETLRQKWMEDFNRKSKLYQATTP
jgi:hypothetical protein